MRTFQVLRRLVWGQWGGIETVVVSLSRALQRAGVETEVLCTAALDRPGEEDADGLHIRRFAYSYLRAPLMRRDRDALDRKGGNPLVPGLIRAILSQKELDLVACHTMARMGGSVRAACRMRGIPYVVTLHGGYFHVPKNEQVQLRAPTRRSVDLGRPLDLAFGASRYLADAAAILCLAEDELHACRERLPGVPSYRLRNGVDTDRFAGATAGDGLSFRRRHGIPDDAPLVLCLARVDPQKGQDVLLRATARLIRRHPALHVAVVGPETVASFAEELRKAAGAAGLADRFRLVGPVGFSDPALPGAYRAADIFVLPSRHEPFGVVLLEAWAAGRPVVASAVGGIPGFVEHERTGLLVPSDDEVALAAALDRALGDPSLRRALGQAGQAEARARFDWAAITAEVRSIYDDAVRTTRRRW
ncbi:MAG: glycosyl transferase family 1 [Myxococcales bacterium]